MFLGLLGPDDTDPGLQSLISFQLLQTSLSHYSQSVKTVGKGIKHKAFSLGVWILVLKYQNGNIVDTLHFFLVY